MKMRIAKGSLLVFDGWRSTAKAAVVLGFKTAPPVIHKVEWRNAKSGFHTNDIESENNRVKHWNRARYSVLKLTERDLHEYTYYSNGGDSMKDIMKGLAATVGRRGRSVRLF